MQQDTWHDGDCQLGINIGLNLNTKSMWIRNLRDQKRAENRGGNQLGRVELNKIQD
jgi:hypothetical protein